MAVAQWEEIYRGYTQEELQAELTELRKSAAGGYVSQGVGNVSHSRDLAEVRDRLQAATRIWQEKFVPGGSGSGNVPYNNRRGVVDFSGVRRDGL